MNVPSWQITEQEYTERRCSQQKDPAMAKMRWTRSFQLEYRNRLRKAMRRGEDIPTLVLEQSQEIRKVILAEIKRQLKSETQVSPKLQLTAEYEKALSGRRRYEKGWKTSYANVSESIDMSLRKTHGVKVKRQDASPITDTQKAEIADGLDELVSVLGDKLFAALNNTDLTICHTNGKCPFLNDAAGSYVASERSVSIGTVLRSSRRKVRALAHEIAHWMDFEAGKAAGMETDITDLTRVSMTALWRGNYTKRKTSALSEAGRRDLACEKHNADLIAEARCTINRAADVTALLSVASEKEGTQRDKGQERQEAKVRLGPYWTRPREIWARLVEQYVATVLGKKSACAESLSFYSRTPGWWTKRDFNALVPRIKEEIDRRLNLCAGGQRRNE